MAVGDVVSQITSIAGGGNLDYQPAAGVEVMITHVGSNLTVEGLPAVAVLLYNGTQGSEIVHYVSSGATPSLFTNVKQDVRPLKLFINNTNYLRITNLDSDTAANISFCGIQTK